MGCIYISDPGSHTTVHKYINIMQSTGICPCDYCPYPDCVATGAQALGMVRYEAQYSKEHMPDVDKRAIAGRLAWEKFTKKANTHAPSGEEWHRIHGK